MWRQERSALAWHLMYAMYYEWTEPNCTEGANAFAFERHVWMRSVWYLKQFSMLWSCYQAHVMPKLKIQAQGMNFCNRDRTSGWIFFARRLFGWCNYRQEQRGHLFICFLSSFLFEGNFSVQGEMDIIRMGCAKKGQVRGGATAMASD